MPFLRSYTPDYFSLEDILVTNERVICKFITEVPRLGFLNPGSEKRHIKAGTTVELPQWLAHHLSKTRPQIATLEIPRVYNEAYREILKADACVVDLHQLQMHFYNLGIYVSPLDDSGLVRNTLIQTFKTRFRLITDLANNSQNNTFTQSFDMLEREIYRVGHKHAISLNKWLTQSNIPMTAAEMVINHKKRKRTEIEDI